MNTKQVGDISEQMVTLELLKLGFDMLQPVGDRLPFDLVAHMDGRFIRIQVKTAYKDNGYWVGNTRRSQTNRKEYKSTPVDTDNCDFFVYVVQSENKFYVFPSEAISQFKSKVSLAKQINCLDNWQSLSDKI